MAKESLATPDLTDVQMLFGLRYIYVYTKTLCVIITIKQSRLQKIPKCFKTLLTLIGCSRHSWVDNSSPSAMSCKLQLGSSADVVHKWQEAICHMIFTSTLYFYSTTSKVMASVQSANCFNSNLISHYFTHLQSCKLHTKAYGWNNE